MGAGGTVVSPPGAQPTPLWAAGGPAELSGVLGSVLDKTAPGASGAASSPFIRHCETFPEARAF